MKVKYLSHMGNDLTIANAAWVSTDRRKNVLDDHGKKLIYSLAKYHETEPFRHCSVSFLITMPIVQARQLIKHRIGMSWSEESRRYLGGDKLDIFYPSEFGWRKDDNKLLQGGVEKLHPNLQHRAHDIYNNAIQECLFAFQQLQELGVCREQARYVLPQAMMTTVQMTGTLLAWAHLCHLRLDKKAQEETKIIAEMIDEEMKKLFPIAWDALSSQFV